MNVFGGILESACLSICPCVLLSVCVQNACFFQSAGGRYLITFSDSSSFFYHNAYAVKPVLSKWPHQLNS